MARIAIAIAAAALLLTATGCGARPETAGEPPDTRPSGEPIAAKVGAELVTVRQVDALLDEARRSFHARGRNFPPESDPYYADLRDEAVRYLVERRLREQIAEQLGVDVSEANRNDLLDFETYRAISQSKQPDETMREALARWGEMLEEQFARVRYVPPYRPAEHRRSIPLELRRLPTPKARCDLKDGMYPYLVARAHGCLGPEDEDVTYSAPPCPEIPVDAVDHGFTTAEIASSYEEYVTSGTRSHDFFEPLTTNREDLASEADPEGPECQDFPGDSEVSVGDVPFHSKPAP
jgi:hypothetical protein